MKHPRSVMRTFSIVFGLLAAWLWASVAIAQEAATADWSGVWDTRWRDHGAQIILEQAGNRVTGTYTLFEGRIEAETQGRELRGRWIQEDNEGEFIFVQSPDGRSFTGRFGTGEWWTGARVANRLVEETTQDQSTPRATMRAFLAAANEAADGNVDAFAAAVALVYSEEREGAAADRFDLARALFVVIDQTTLRIWDLPLVGEEESDTVTARIEQAGTGRSVSVSFPRNDGRWYLAPNSIEQLNMQRDQLEAARKSTEVSPQAALGPDSPREAMRRFLLSFRYSPDRSAPDALSALDLRGRAEITQAHDGQVLAGYLKRVIDRTGYVIWQEIPDDPYSVVPYVHFEHPEGNVVISPVDTSEGVVWQFTPETLRTVRAVYSAMEDMPTVPGLKALPENDIHFAIRQLIRGVAPSMLLPLGPLERWQWAALVATLIAILAASALLSILVRLTGWVFARTTPEDGTSSLSTVTWSLQAVAAGLVFFGAGWILGLPERITLVLAGMSAVLIVFGLFLLGWYWIGLLAERARKAKRISSHNLILLSLASGVLRGLLLVSALLIIVHQLSIPLTGVLASFGIGGIAFALAAQPTLQNLLSGFTIYADRPLSVGDFCRFGDQMGTVEEIGLRSTRLRTLDRTVISVPNSQFHDMQLENYTRRDRFLFTTNLALRYETTPDQLRYLLAELRKLLIAHPMVVSDPLRVRFAALGAHSLDVEIFSYILASDIDAFSAIREDLLLRVMATVDLAGTQFAFPSVVNYAATDQGLEAERIAEVEAKVDNWRASGDLPFPDFEWQSKAEWTGTLDYPPQGSVLRRTESGD